MKRFIVCAGIALTLLVFCASQAEARIFEPQRNWWSSGRTCIESRNPPGLAWDGLPPRACVVRVDAALRKPQRDVASKDGDFALASANEPAANKFTAKV